MHHSIIILGRLGNDPEIRYMPNGEVFARFNVASNRTLIKDGVKKRETTWFRIYTFGRMAHFAEKYLKRGRNVFVEGHLRSNPKTGGPTIYRTKTNQFIASYEVLADSIRFIPTTSTNQRDGNFYRHEHSDQKDEQVELQSEDKADFS